MTVGVRIQAEVPPGPSIFFGLRGDSELSRGSSGVGGWQIVDRPRRKASTEWTDYAPWQLTLPLILEGYDTSVEAQIAVVESWDVPPSGGLQPPVLGIAGPIPHHDLQWVLYSADWKDSLKDPATGERTQQTVDVVLWEYSPASTTVMTPAQAAQQATLASSGSTGSTVTASGQTYTVRSGDTLWAIAVRLLGNANAWTSIATLNSIRDPRSLQVGQVLQVPARTR